VKAKGPNNLYTPRFKKKGARTRLGARLYEVDPRGKTAHSGMGRNHSGAFRLYGESEPRRGFEGRASRAYDQPHAEADRWFSIWLAGGARGVRFVRPKAGT